jgi:hypothetical protein
MNRRNRLRFSTDMFVTITGVDDTVISMKGRLANLSAHGLSLILPGKVPSGITVNVEWGEYKVRGQLIYCQPYGNEYRVGLEVEDPRANSPLFKKCALNKNGFALPLVL